MVRPILQYGYATLHQRSEEVSGINDSIWGLVVDMTETMYKARGIGLAAPQIGVPLRVIVIDLSMGKDKKQLIRLVNPEIVWREGSQQEEEGCLSVNGYHGSPVRPAKVDVEGLGLDKETHYFEADGLLARAFCHEIDHLDGLLFIDRLSPLKRNLAERKLKKEARRRRMLAHQRGTAR